MASILNVYLVALSNVYTSVYGALVCAADESHVEPLVQEILPGATIMPGSLRQLTSLEALKCGAMVVPNYTNYNQDIAQAVEEGWVKKLNT